ncbi:MAG: DinB family protein [Chloroflexota bacterium]
MSNDQVMREQLLALLRGGNAHLTFEQAVADFPAEAINRRPPNVSYTPWHLLEHIRLAQWDILEFVRNPDHVSPDWPKGYWPAPDEQADEVRWRQTLAAFRADMQAIEAMVSDPHLDLLAPIPHAPDYTIFREVLLVADHNAYHIGEFAILRQMMDTWPANSRRP